jgi:hypothetical protein
MKGSAASHLNGLIREHKGDLLQILEGIQDIYIPQHTIYDDVEELNKFKRLPNENIKSTMRRASMIIERLSPTCTSAAWPERKYHLLLSLLKQLIDKKVFKELHIKELEAAQTGIRLDIAEIITFIAVREATHEVVPTTEVALAYNINSLQLMNQPQNPKDEIEELRVRINSLMAKKPRLDHGGKTSSRGGFKRAHPDSEKRDNASSHSSHFSSGRGSNHSFQNSQRRLNGKRDFRGASSSSTRSFQKVNGWLNNPNNQHQSRPILSTRNWRENRSKSREGRSQSRESRYSRSSSYPSFDRQRSSSRGPNRYDRYRSQSRGRSSSRNRNSYGHRGNYNRNGNHSYRGKNFKKSFGRGTNTVTMTFYQCELCPKTHLKGTTCNTVKR